MYHLEMRVRLSFSSSSSAADAAFDAVIGRIEDIIMGQISHSQLIPSFNMTAFTHLLMQHKEEVPVDIFDMLLSFTDFLTFKEMFLDYRAEKEGKGLDLSQGLVVTPLSCTGCSRHIGSTGTS
uniref:ADP-ribosylation factor-like protein 2-binding protein n=1 Tax=Gadus morhua TaxID=8049 RepID=A0A8C5CAJ4_GADMO